MKYFIVFLPVFLLQQIVLGQPVSLSDTANQYDYVVITVPEFKAACEAFKLHKETFRNFKVLIVDTSEIFSEFDSSLIKQDNIRNFISYAGTFWKNPKPKYFLIAGDLSKIPNYEFESVPGYEQTDTARSDYYYTTSKYSNSNEISFCVGRIAARNGSELNNYFNKVIQYEGNSNLSSWNNNILILSDDQYTTEGNDDDLWITMSLNLGKLAPDYMNVKYFFEDDSSQYYGPKDSIVHFINNDGAAAVFFVGHGNSSVFTHEQYFTFNDVDLIHNGNKYFITFFVGSQYFSRDTIGSITDKFLFSEGGSIGALNYVGEHYLQPNNDFLSKCIKYIFTNPGYTLGETWRNALKPATFQNKLINIFGDPSLKLKFDILADKPPENILPAAYSLKQNYPNPFNPITAIKFILPEDGMVQMKVYNILGNEVATILNSFYKAGEHTVNFNAADLSSGVYFYTIKSKNFTQTKKMMLLK